MGLERDDRIRTTHITKMLEEAASMSQAIDGTREVDSFLVPKSGWQFASSVAFLERAANLAEHAAAELCDEMLRARDGWPVI